MVTEVMETVKEKLGFEQLSALEKEIRRVTKLYAGKAVIETNRDGKEFPAIIREICWDSSVYNPEYKEDGDWLIRIEYTEGVLKGIPHWTNKRALRLAGEV